MIVRSLVIAGLLAALGTAANVAHAADEPTLVDQRTIEIPDSRIIAISPDSTAIAASDFGLNELCIYEIETLVERVCTDLEPLDAGLRIEDVAWSPDSTKLALAEQAFVRFIDGDLWLMDAFTGELTNLTDDGVRDNIPLIDKTAGFTELFVDGSPIWLPDGSGITFSRSIWRDGDWFGNTIETVSGAGGPPELLTIVTLDNPGVVYFGMRWTADASTLIYSVNPPDASDPTTGIWSIGADGLGATKLAGADPELGTPLVGGISPDGNTILVYYAMAAGRYISNGDYYYALLDVASGRLTPVLPESSDYPEHALLSTVVLSPDGGHVVYVTRLTIPDFQVAIRPVSGGDEIVLVPEGLEAAGPIALTASLTWSDNGTLLLHGPSPSSGTLLRIDGVAKSPSPPPIETPSTPTAGTLTGDFATGDTVTANDNDVPLRSAPGIDAQTVATLTAGTELTVVGPPVDADGFVWVPVTDPATGTIGYIRAEFVDVVE